VTSRPLPVASQAWTALLPLLIPGAIITWALAGNRWSLWGVEAMEAKTPSSTSFADLSNITATADCLSAGSDYTLCDPYGRPFQPYVVIPARILETLGLGTNSTGTLGWLLAMIFVLTLGFLGLVLARLWRGSKGGLIAAQLVLAGAAVTPPAMLAIERGQIEIIAFALAAVALVLLTMRSTLPNIIGAILGALTAWLKYFAIGLFAPFISRETFRRRSSIWAMAGLALGAVFLLVSWNDINQAASASRADLPATTKSQFGAATLVSTVLSDSPIGYAPSAPVADDWSSIRLAGLIVTAIAVLIALILTRRPVVAIAAVPESIAAFLLGSAGVLALPYVLGSSHDYRLIFLLIGLTATLAWISHSRGAVRRFAVLIAIAIAISLMTGASMVPTPTGFLMSKWALVLGDICLLFVLSTAAAIWLRRLVYRPTTITSAH
jgi:hypothetical protein